jgi:chaperonin GroES
MPVQPLRDFILVTKEETPKQTTGGLYMPDTVEEKVVSGTVVAVGTGRVTSDGSVLPLEVKKGDKVVFNRHFATDLNVDNQTYYLLKEEQLFCVVK